MSSDLLHSLRYPSRLSLREMRRDLFFSKEVARAIRDTERTRWAYSLWLKPGDTYVDIGTHGGELLETAMRYATGGKFHAVEPLPHLAAALQKRFPEITVHNCALSHTSEQATFYHPLEWEAWSGLRVREYPAGAKVEKIDVTVRTLDEILGEMVTPDLIKIDVEGAELEVFQGGKNLFKRCRPLLAFEHDVGAYRSYGVQAAQLWDLLAGEWKYRIFDLYARGPLERAEFSDLADSGQAINFLARP